MRKRYSITCSILSHIVLDNMHTSVCYPLFTTMTGIATSTSVAESEEFLLATIAAGDLSLECSKMETIRNCHSKKRSDCLIDMVSKKHVLDSLLGQHVYPTIDSGI